MSRSSPAQLGCKNCCKEELQASQDKKGTKVLVFSLQPSVLVGPRGLAPTGPVTPGLHELWLLFLYDRTTETTPSAKPFRE